MNLSETHNIYFGKRDLFYCVEIADKSVVRDNQLSELLGENLPRFIIVLSVKPISFTVQNSGKIKIVL